MLADPVDALTDVAMRLDEAGVAYMLTGSVAGYFYGLNRSTGDTDLVVDIAGSDVAPFVTAFADAWYCDRLMIEEAVAAKEMFNVIPKGGGKLDFVPLRDEPFELTKFGRRVPHDWKGYPVWVTTADDLVLSKLQWAHISHSPQQFGDVQTIMAAGFVDEHSEYFQRWIEALGLADTLAASRPERHVG